MGDKAAAEARKQKIRNLEYSLFGGNDNNNVSIGDIMTYKIIMLLHLYLFNGLMVFRPTPEHLKMHKPQ